MSGHGLIEYGPDQVRHEHGRPVSAGDQALTSPTQLVTTRAGTWALYGIGDGVLLVHPGGAVAGPAGEVAGRLRALAGPDGGADDDRAAATTLLAYVSGADDPGRADTPRSAGTGQPAGYHLSGPRNAPAGHTGTASGSADPDAPPA